MSDSPDYDASDAFTGEDGVRNGGPSDEVQGLHSYLRQNPETVREKAAMLEANGYEEVAGYTRYHLSLALGKRPDPEDADAAGIQMPEDIVSKEEGTQ
jgi:hypothetical protein